MEKINLKPCPFCGSGNIAVECFNLFGQKPSWSIWCRDCLIGTNIWSIRRTKEEAIKKWNTRSYEIEEE